ncbi:MAG: hypothetical protein ACI8RD_004735 [Bacillariaceae sp.]|jgi:hypothetical protein
MLSILVITSWVARDTPKIRANDIYIKTTLLPMDKTPPRIKATGTRRDSDDAMMDCAFGCFFVIGINTSAPATLVADYLKKQIGV